MTFKKELLVNFILLSTNSMDLVAGEQINIVYL